MLFIVLVVGPYIRKLPMRDKMFYDLGKRYQGVGTFIVLLHENTSPEDRSIFYCGSPHPLT